jgi:hypothetical protein
LTSFATFAKELQPCFVLDGDRHPGVKCGAEVIDKEIWWTDNAIELIKNFGFYYHKVARVQQIKVYLLNIFNRPQGKQKPS